MENTTFPSMLNSPGRGVLFVEKAHTQKLFAPAEPVGPVPEEVPVNPVPYVLIFVIVFTHVAFPDPSAARI
jgi:hypothetical protein